LGDFVGDFSGDFVGDFLGNFLGDFLGDFPGDFPRVSFRLAKSPGRCHLAVDFPNVCRVGKGGLRFSLFSESGWVFYICVS